MKTDATAVVSEFIYSQLGHTSEIRGFNKNALIISVFKRSKLDKFYYL